MSQKKTQFFYNQWVGVICILIASLFVGLWYNFMQRAQFLESITTNNFFNGTQLSEIDDYKFYAKLFLIIAILLLVLGGYIIRNVYLRSKEKI